MIISQSSVNMASSREYRKSYSRSNTSFRQTLDGKQQQLSQSQDEVTFSANEDYSYCDNYNNLSIAAGLRGTYEGNNISGSYLRYSKASTDTVSDNSLSNQQSVTVSSDGDTLENFKSLYAQRRMIILSLLDVFQRARFKLDARDFMDLSGYGGYGSYDSSTLSLTSSPSSTVWKQLSSTQIDYSEREATSFGAVGSVVTADGRSIDIDITFSMTREFAQSYGIEEMSYYTQILTDPLVISLDSAPAQVSSEHFLFDIDSDGTKEDIAQLSSGSGYLALDKNGDGVINDGSELFGTKSGDGFADLAEYDSDGNGWIDENDDIYSQLKVWTFNEDGTSELIDLKSADVGAIYLGSAKTEFSHTNDDNEVLAQVRSSGIYLHEDGSSGVIQQMDF